jgi:hypothetical protein
MSGPDETLPPHDRETLDELPAANDTIPPPPDAFGVPDAIAELAVVPVGLAQVKMEHALSDLARAFKHVEALGMGLARALDLQGGP